MEGSVSFTFRFTLYSFDIFVILILNSSHTTKKVTFIQSYQLQKIGNLMNEKPLP